MSVKLLYAFPPEVLPFLEQHLPAFAQESFGKSSGLRDMDFEFSPLEPAVNRYETGGKVQEDAFGTNTFKRKNG